MSTKLEWESIDANHFRAQIFGGWLVKAYEDAITTSRGPFGEGTTGYEYRIAMCFVPDLNHEWIIGE